jgi:N-acetylmuramic acid 6-phosphate etherase
MSTESRKKADHFLSISSQFRLGVLDTEKSHPRTANLSTLVEKDLSEAIRILKEVDLEALQAVLRDKDGIMQLKAAIEEVLEAGGRIFLAGCGSTGRLSLVLEVLWRSENAGTELEESVVAFMAGGDTALIRSIEDFEDHPEFARRQLEALGFSAKDLLIASTEGGETPFVIGATEKAAALSRYSPWFLYCNPDEQLLHLTERTHRILTHPGVSRINLSAGPMALSGSTRMQASTVLMYAIGLALLHAFGELDVTGQVKRLLSALRGLDYSFLNTFILRESEIYKKGAYMVYLSEDDPGICILTDTTERSPTFSLHPFENYRHGEKIPSLVYLCLPDAANAADGWRKLLHRPPRPLDWPDYPVTTHEQLMGFDFSRKLIKKREKLVAPAALHRFVIIRSGSGLRFSLEGIQAMIPAEGLSLLHQHLLLKMLLNIHSTLVMGKLGRYEGNLMTYVRPSNYKLIDRTARYVTLLLEKDGRKVAYPDVIRSLFEVMEKESNQNWHRGDMGAIVLDTYHFIQEKN